MQEKRRAQIVGTQSCGCVLGVLKHRELNGGGELAISEVAFVTPQGCKLEGNGVVPDRKVALTLTDLQRQRDTALEEAEKHLNNLLKREFLRTHQSTKLSDKLRVEGTPRGVATGRWR